MENYEILWNKTLSVLEKNISGITYATFIEKLKAVDLQSRTLILNTPSDMFASGSVRIADKILEAFQLAETGITDFKIFVGKNSEPYFSSISSEDENLSMPIDPKYTFDNYVVGQSNRYVYAAAKSVAEDPGNSYNPLFIYGQSGLGKTHIMHAIANKIAQDKPNLKIMYVTCEKFTNDLINAIRQGRAYSGEGSENFRKYYRSVDVLIIDDVQFLAKKQSTQEEFFHTFNELYSNNKQIILSADCHPNEIELLNDRLKTRFQGGLLAQITPPDVETKIAILQKKAEQKKIILPFEVASFLTENSADDVRSLEGLLKKVIFVALLKDEPISLSLAEEAINMSQPKANQTDPITTDSIIRTVCGYYKISENDLVGKKKNKELVEPRQICMYLISELMNIPLVSIGQALGGRDHTTVIHAKNKISELIKTNNKIATDVSDLKNLILKK